MKRFLTIALLLTIVAPVAAQSVDDALNMNGLAVFEQLRHEYYLGALYLPATASTPDDAVSMAGPKRMDLRIITDGWSPRRFARQWNQLISINNPPELQEKLADEIIAFTSLPKGDLRAGDQLVITQYPDKGTEIRLNGTRLMQTGNGALFNLLLNCWVGPRPPSSTFKKNILNMPQGEEGSRLLVLYDVSEPGEARRKETAAWKGSSSPPKAEKPEQAAPQVERSNPAPPRKSEEELARERREREEAERARQAAAERERQAAIRKALAEAEAKARAEARRQQVINEYSSKMVLASYEHVRYPKRALKLNQQGTVMLEVILNRGGDLVSVDVLQSSSYPALDDAAIKAVQRTAPFPKMPDEITEDSIKFTLPFTFQISG